MAGRPGVRALQERIGQEIYYMDGAAYTQFARHAFENEKEVVERLGLAKKEKA